MRLRTLCLVLLAFAFLTATAHAANTVSSFTIANSTVIGNSTQYATGTIVVQRDPGNPTGNITVGLDFAGPTGTYECEPNHQGVNFRGCYVLDGETSTTVKLWGSCVSATAGGTVKAYNLGNPADPGQTAAMTVNPLQVTMTIAPTLYYGGTNQVGNGRVSVNATLRQGINATLSSNPAVPFVYTPGATIGIPAGGTYADFTIQAQTVSQNTTTTVTATTSCGPPASAPATVVAGGEPNLGLCPDCKGAAGKPINLTNGNVWIRQQDYALPGLGGGLEVTRTWNSLWEKVTYIELSGAFGRGWRSTYEERLGALSGGYRKYWREDGSAWLFRWDSINQGYVLVSPPEARASLTYDSSTTKYTLTFLDVSKRIFNSGGYLIALVDRNGNQTTITLTGSNRPSQVTDAAGRWVRFNYDAYARITSLQDSTGTLATYTWNGFNLSRATYADGSFINYSYDASNRMLSVTDTNGKVLESHTYDSGNRGLTSQRANLVDKLTVAYTSNSSTRLTDSLGNITDYTFQPKDGRQFITSITGPGCASCGGRNNQSSGYDAAGNQTSSTDALGRTTTYTYDANGNVLTRTQFLSGAPITWSYTYNGFGQVLTATDPLGHTTTNVYDVKGNLLTTTTSSPDGTQAGSTTSFAYDVKGQLTSATDPLSNATSIFYTAAGLVDHITDAQSNTTTFGYDARGNRTSVTGALGHQTTFTYNNMSRLTRVTNPDTTHTDFAYDNRGRRTSVTDANAKVTSCAYDDADRLVTVTDAQTPTHGVTTYAYDTENNLLSITDALGRVTSFTYDALGRVTQTTFPSTLIETYTDDAVGNLTSKTDRKGQVIGYSYDELDRLTHKGYPDSTGVDYTYDAASRLTNVSDPTGTYQFSFDNMGRLTGTTTDYSFLTSRTFTNAYAYDAGSNRTSFTDPENGVTSYVYDTLNRLSTLTPPAAISSGSFGFSHDALSRRTQMTRPNAVNTNYSYDNLSRLLSVLHTLNSTTIDGATYTVDAVGNRTAKTNQLTAVTENYSYDAIYQLLQVTQGANTTENYTYDSVGNRLSSLGISPYSYNNSNQLNSKPTAAYTYDNNGNTLTKTDASGATTYAWDFENRLVSVALPGSGGTVSFKYDPFGRRIQKSSASGTTNYVYDGANMAEEVDATGSALARYTMGPGIDQPLAMLRGGATTYYQADGLGSITSLTDSSGSVAGSHTYDLFGRPLGSSGALVNPFRYTGRELDPETGLYYYRARYYDSENGRFLSEDPIQALGGLNFYEYVNNGPATLVDPSGLSPKPVRPYRWRYCTGAEVSQCRQLCASQGKEYESCRVSQLYRIGPQGWSAGPDWIDGPLSCSCAEENECNKASQPNPEAAKQFKNGIIMTVIIAAGAYIASQPELWPALPVLGKLAERAFAH